VSRHQSQQYGNGLRDLAFNMKAEKKDFSSIRMKRLQTGNIEKNNQPDTYDMNAACTSGSIYSRESQTI
jgi:hypothetical protein